MPFAPLTLRWAMLFCAFSAPNTIFRVNIKSVPDDISNAVLLTSAKANLHKFKKMPA